MKELQRVIRGFVFLFVVMVLFGGAQQAFASKKSDELTNKVNTAIHSYYPGFFKVTANDTGRVEVEGTVSVLYDRLRIYEIVSKVPGVRSIELRIPIRTPILADAVIQSDANQLIRLMHSILEPDRIKISVDNGVAILGGEVSFQREKILVETAISQIKGVKGIVNNIKVLPPHEAVSDENLQYLLNEILKNQFPLEKKVHFTVKNGVVTVDGTTSLLWAKMEIEKEFSKVSGVKKVVNQLMVKEF